MNSFNFFKVKENNKQTVGVELHTTGITMCAVSRQNSKVIINDVRFEPYENIENNIGRHEKLERALKSLVGQSNISKIACDVVLSPHDYQLLLIEAPDVPTEEMKAAVKWKIKDLVSIPQEFIFVEVFDLPKGEKKTTKKMIYVVVTDIRELKSIVDSFADASLEINSINIQEMAIRDLIINLQEHKDEKKSLALIRITKGIGYIFIFSENNLFLSRQFKISYGGGLFDEIPKEIIQVEMQRSLDYYERQMSQIAPNEILFFGENILADKVESMNDNDFNVKINIFNIDLIFETKDDHEQVLLNGLGSLGGALRYDQPINV